MTERKQIDAFSNCHPIVIFFYYISVFVFTTFVMHPFFLIISLSASLAYAVSLIGKKKAYINLLWLSPVILVTMLINPIFNNRGVTMLTYLPSGNPLTLESIIYGLAAGLLLSTTVVWFMTFNQVMTSDKFVYLFGKLIPSLSLVLSMTLRFVPQFKNQMHKVANTQRAIGKDVSNGTLFQRLRHGINILSIMVTWALENAIETSDSMKSRGYGLPGRTAYSIYQFDKRDRTILICLFIFDSYLVTTGLFGLLEWRYFPMMTPLVLDIPFITILVTYIALCFIPLIVNKEEEKQWQVTQLKT